MITTRDVRGATYLISASFESDLQSGFRAVVDARGKFRLDHLMQAAYRLLPIPAVHPLFPHFGSGWGESVISNGRHRGGRITARQE